jgi:hypothetical protein
MTPTILFQEAYVATAYFLNIDFEYDSKFYTAQAHYYNGSGLQNVEIYEQDKEGEIVSDEIIQIGEKLLFNMDIDSNLTF